MAAQITPADHLRQGQTPSARPTTPARRDDGGYEIRTVRPVDYTIPVDGPGGRHAPGPGRPAWRPAHVHFKAIADSTWPSKEPDRPG